MTTIRLARDADLPLLGPIEDAGDTLFVERFGAVDWPPATTGEERAAEPGILLVAEDDDGAVVGFTHVVDLGGTGTSSRSRSTRRTAGAASVAPCSTRPATSSPDGPCPR